jgi:tetratricopeptide (TPR) repeat protein
MMNPREIQDLISRREYARAETVLRERLKAQPENADAHYLWGVLNYFQGRLAPTAESLRRALQLDPRHTDAAICLSVLMNDIGRYDDAKKVFEQANQSIAIKQSGQDTDADRKFAVKHLELADFTARVQLGLLHYSQGNILDAELEWESILEIEPEHREARAYLDMARQARQS